MPTPNPNPTQYPPYAGYTYPLVHTQNTWGKSGKFYIKTLTTLVTTVDNSTYPPTETTVDTYPNGTDFTTTAKYQIWNGQYGVVLVSSQTPPWTAFGNSGYPLTFDSLAKAEDALRNVPAVYLEAKYSFYGRDPRKEMAQTIAAYDMNSEEFAEVDGKITASLTSRTVTAANSAYSYYSAKLVNQDGNNQFALGLSAASGGGQNTTYLANSLSVQQLQDAATAALNYAAGIPIVVPFESPLVSDSHASAIEAKNAGEIRDQQIRQTLASAAGVTAGWTQALASGYTWEGASIVMGAFGQRAAASET